MVLQNVGKVIAGPEGATRGTTKDTIVLNVLMISLAGGAPRVT